MKKILLALFVAAGVSVAVSAQDKGDMYISGNFTIESGSTRNTVGNVVTKTPATMSFGIAPQFGYFVIDRLEVNFSLGFTHSRYNNGTDEDDNPLFRKTNVFAITPGVRYYVPLGEKFWYTPGFDLSVGFGGNSRDIDKQTVVKGGVTQFGLNLSAVAFEFRPAEHFGITLRAGGLSYSMDRSTSKGSTKTSSVDNDFSFSINTGASIGFKYYF